MSAKKIFCFGISLIAVFMLWTFLIQVVDVRYIGQNGTAVGFASLNARFHAWTGVHMALYTLTDFLGLVPIFCCMCFGVIGFMQWGKQKSLFRVDADILILGIYDVIVILCYLIFEIIPINYRPIPINGIMEASYPSSTTLLVLSVMPTVIFQIRRRMKNTMVRKMMIVFSVSCSLFMVIGRTVAGVHWLTDIIGAVLLSAGLFLLYQASVTFCCKKSKE